MIPEDFEEEALQRMERGCTVRLCGTCSLPENARNPGEFNQSRYLAGKMVRYIIRPGPGDITYLNEKGIRWLPPALLASRVRTSVRTCLTELLGGRIGGFVLAVMTGETAGIEKTAKTHMRASGMSHLMAVSGMHVGFLLTVFRKIYANRYMGWTLRNLLLLIPIIFYFFLADASASVFRACIMSGYAVLARGLFRPYDSLNGLGLAGCLQLAYNPYFLYDSGFLLSYGAAASMILILPKLRREKNILSESRGAVKQIYLVNREALKSGIAVNAGVFPILLYQFHQFSAVGLLLNLYAAPLAGAVCIGGFLLYVLSSLPLIRIFAPLFAYLLAAAASGLNQLAAIAGALPAPVGTAEIPAPGCTFFILYYGLLILIFYKRLRQSLFQAVRKKWKLAAAVCLCAGIAVFYCTYQTKVLEVLFFDVGQGACAFIKTNTGIRGLVDTGTGKTDIPRLLKKQGTKRLDFIILTHGHADHAGGIPDILSQCGTKYLFIPDNPSDAGAVQAEEAAKRHGTAVVRISAPCTYRFGNLTVRFFCFLPDTAGSREADINNSSLTAEVRCRYGGVLFPGDLQQEGEQVLAEKGLLKACDVLAAAHHGSDTSNTEIFLSYVRPEYAIISAGRKNRYGHPAETVLQRFQKHGIAVYRTDHSGAVSFVFGRKTVFRDKEIQIWKMRENKAAES